MNEIPGFLLALGLRPDADERAVRRAYALELKKIDQETQADAFQRLRETYEAALTWARSRLAAQYQETPAPQECAEAGTPVSPPAQGSREPPEPTESTAESHRPTDTRENVQDVVVSFGQRLSKHPLQAVDEAQRVLEDTLEDPRLLDMDARFLFEANIAHILATGWQPGHEHLFEAASEVFEWRNGTARLQRLGQAGQIVDSAIVEQHAHEALPPAQRELQLKYLDLLRRGSSPDPEMVALGLDPVLRAASLFPNWVRLTSKIDNIAAWREVDAAAARSTFMESRTTVSTGPSGTLKPAKLVAWFAIFFVGVMLFALLQAYAKWSGARVPTTQPLTMSQTPLPSASPPPEIPTQPRLAAAADRSPLPGTTPTAEYIRPPRPGYPAMSRRLGEQGKVTVNVLADEKGAVIGTRVAESSGFERLDAAALDAARAAQIVPMKDRNGKPVTGWYKVPINFTLNSATTPTENRNWGDLITAAVRPNIVFAMDVPGNPMVEYTLDLAPDGKITNATLSKASGVSEWDSAALRAIRKTGYLPLPDQGKIPPQMILALRPKVR